MIMANNFQANNSEQALAKMTEIIYNLEQDRRQLSIFDNLCNQDFKNYHTYLKEMCTLKKQLQESLVLLGNQLDTYPVAHENQTTARIFNRDVLEDYSFFLWSLKRELARVKRFDYELILLSVRIINIAEIASGFGPDSMEETLNQTSGLLQTNSRSTDLLWQNPHNGRFILVLTDTHCEHSQEIRTRIKDTFKNYKFTVADKNIPVKIAVHFLTQTSETVAEPKELLEILG